MQKNKVKTKSATILNREASHNYFIEDTLECGIALRGNEVKSIRSGMATLKGAWVDITDNELILKGMNITRWETANSFDVDEKRNRILLAHKSEILKLQHKTKEQGITLIPLEVYLVKNKYKVKIGICRGKHNYDKRQSLKEQHIKRDIERQLKR